MARRSGRRFRHRRNINPEADILFSVARPFVLCVRIERYTDDQVSEQELNLFLEKFRKFLEDNDYRIFNELLGDRAVYLYIVRQEIAQKAEEYLRNAGVDIEKLKAQSPLADSSDEELREEPEIEIDSSKLAKPDS